MYRLLRHIKTGINGGETLFLADVNGDGKKEFIIRQSGGFYDSKFIGMIFFASPNIIIPLN